LPTCPDELTFRPPFLGLLYFPFFDAEQEPKDNETGSNKLQINNNDNILV